MAQNYRNADPGTDIKVDDITSLNIYSLLENEEGVETNETYSEIPIGNTKKLKRKPKKLKKELKVNSNNLTSTKCQAKPST